MQKDFAIRLDQAYSCLNPIHKEVSSAGTSESTELKPEDIQMAKDRLLPLVKEAYEAKMVIERYDNGVWKEIISVPISECMILPRCDSEFTFIHDGHINVYDDMCRFRII